jgi:hypothetical protein
MRIEWTRCLNYEQARNFKHCIYLHEWSDKPFYWGKIRNSFFGGHMRTLDGIRASGRYNAGYKHWIEGCLQNGARLYLGQLTRNGPYSIDQVENYLIATYPSQMNVRLTWVDFTLYLKHEGDIPAVLRNQ